MQIDIPPPEQIKLARLAMAAGYDDVERFVTEQVLALANQSTLDELPPPTDEELRTSLAMCDCGMAELDAGKGRGLRDALDDIARKYGLNTER